MQKNVEKMSINYSPNFEIKKRSISSVKYLIYHYTGMRSEKAAIKRLTNKNSKVSCHYFIKKNGEIVKIVPDLYIAWHAGISSWKKDKSLNSNSDIIRFAMPSMCAASFSAEKTWLDKFAGSNWDQRVKINAEILKDGEIKKSV